MSGRASKKLTQAQKYHRTTNRYFEKSHMYGIAAELFFTDNIVKASLTPLSIPKEMDLLFALNSSAIIMSTRVARCPVRESRLTLRAFPKEFTSINIRSCQSDLKPSALPIPQGFLHHSFNRLLFFLTFYFKQSSSNFLTNFTGLRLVGSLVKDLETVRRRKHPGKGAVWKEELRIQVM